MRLGSGFFEENEMDVGQYVIPVAIPQPQLYRYMEEKYVDNFIEQGKLRLCSFKRYREEDHKEIGDEFEGISTIQVFAKNFFSFEKVEIVNNSYILCTSSMQSKDVQEKFGADSCFVIGDLNAFASDIARNIPGCTGVIHGPCIYQNMLDHYLPQFGFANNPSKEETLIFSQQLKEKLKFHPYFHKAYSLRDQYEYRFVFITDRIAKKEIHIECKSAMRYCEKISLTS